MALYIASDSPLALIPWDDASPAFHVLDLQRDADEHARHQFTKPFVVYAGSDEGCGCGFFKLRDRAFLEPDEVQACKESLRRLGDYLDAAMAQAGELELFTSWEGDQG